MGIASARVITALIAVSAGSFAALADDAPQFRPTDRSVSNWRAEAGEHLDLTVDKAKSLTDGSDAGVTRCVRLNNYWCIKGIGWAGMIAADREGHVAFASATEGAAVAALLLKRYYLDYARRSAQAIVTRWAPAQCLGPVALATRRTTVPGMMQNRKNLGPEPRQRADALSRLGIGSTLRARWLARHGGRRVARASVRRSVVADSMPRLIKTPEISIGMGEKPMAMPELKLASLTIQIPEPPSRTAPFAAPAPAPRPSFSCSGDTVRLKNYAQQAIAGVAASPGDDLKLFEPDGTPTPNLRKVMANMSGVEIGPMRADMDVIDAGIARAMAALQASRAKPPPETAPPAPAPAAETAGPPAP